MKCVSILIFTANSFQLASFSNFKYKWNLLRRAINDGKYFIILLFICTNCLNLSLSSERSFIWGVVCSKSNIFLTGGIRLPQPPLSRNAKKLTLSDRSFLYQCVNIILCRGYSNVVLLPFCGNVNLVCGVVIYILWCCKKSTCNIFSSRLGIFWQNKKVKTLKH